MADVDQAIKFVIELEDDKRHPGCITQLAGDSGGKTRLGIAARFHPQLAAGGFFDGTPIEGSSNPLRWAPTTVSTKDGVAVATKTYQTEYTDPLAIAQIASQRAANAFLGLAVNAGARNAVASLQRCLPGVVVDGEMGPKTLQALNSLPEDQFMALFQAEQIRFYSHIESNNPSLAAYAKGFKNRIEAA